MPYARRDAQGSLLSLHRRAEPGAEEFLDDAAPEVLSFLGEPTADRFSQLDADFVRVLEDVVDALIARNVLNETDLPPQARDKLYLRRGHRRESALSRLNLLGEASGLGISDFTLDGTAPN
jgi:hypothetical protein